MIDHEQILKALFASRGPSVLANDFGISAQAVHQWRRVPVKRAKEIEQLTGIPREELRPDIFGEI